MSTFHSHGPRPQTRSPHCPMGPLTGFLACEEYSQWVLVGTVDRLVPLTGLKCLSVEWLETHLLETPPLWHAKICAFSGETKSDQISGFHHLWLGNPAHGKTTCNFGSRLDWPIGLTSLLCRLDESRRAPDGAGSCNSSRTHELYTIFNRIWPNMWILTYHS